MIMLSSILIAFVHARYMLFIDKSQFSIDSLEQTTRH